MTAQPMNYLYPAFDVQRTLATFAERRLNLLNQHLFLTKLPLHVVNNEVNPCPVLTPSHAFTRDIQRQILRLVGRSYQVKVVLQISNLLERVCDTLVEVCLPGCNVINPKCEPVLHFPLCSLKLTAGRLCICIYVCVERGDCKAPKRVMMVSK